MPFVLEPFVNEEALRYAPVSSTPVETETLRGLLRYVARFLLTPFLSAESPVPLHSQLSCPSQGYDFVRLSEYYTLPGRPCLVHPVGETRYKSAIEAHAGAAYTWVRHARCDTNGWSPSVADYATDRFPFDSRCAVLGPDGWVDTQDAHRYGTVCSDASVRPRARLSICIDRSEEEAAERALQVATSVLCSPDIYRVVLFTRPVPRLRDALLSVAYILNAFYDHAEMLLFVFGLSSDSIRSDPAVGGDQSLAWIVRRVGDGAVRVHTPAGSDIAEAVRNALLSSSSPSPPTATSE